MSNVSSISTAANTGAAAALDTMTNTSQTLNQNDFLKLLVAQMQYQDPMNPQSDTQMAAQMAQFTALQQSSQMSSSLSMMQANSLVGSTVTVQVDSQTTASGVVQGMIMNNGSPQVIVNGQDYGLSQVLTVTPPAAQTTTATGQTTTTTPATSASSN